jgi:hypothetical protein
MMMIKSNLGRRGGSILYKGEDDTKEGSYSISQRD